MSRLISLFVLVAIIVVIGLLFYKVMVGFFVPVFLAAVLVVVFRPLHKWILLRTGNRERLAAILTTGLIMLSVLLPSSLVIVAASVQGVSLIRYNSLANFEQELKKLRKSLKLEIEYSKEWEDCQTIVRQLVDDSRKIESNEISPNVVSNLRKLEGQLNRVKEKISIDKGPEFNSQFAKLVQLAEDIASGKSNNTESSNGQDNQESGDQDTMDTKESVLNMANEFQKLRVNVLGGDYVTALKDFVNPSAVDKNSIMAQVLEYIQPKILSFTGATSVFLIQLVIGTVILLISIFFFLYDGPGMIKALMSLSPLDDRYEQELLLEFDRISRAMVLATILSALTQGFIAGIGYYFAGLPNQILLIILTTVFAMVPFVGPPIVWIPACIYLAFNQGQTGSAIGLALWGLLVVGTIDNVVKAYVLHGQAQLHPLLALLSVLGGVQALGPIGIVVGPMVVALLQTLLSILQRELIHFEDHTLVVAGPQAAEGARRATRFRTRKKRRSTPESPAAEEPAPVPSEVAETGKAVDDQSRPANTSA